MRSGLNASSSELGRRSFSFTSRSGKASSLFGFLRYEMDANSRLGRVDRMASTPSTPPPLRGVTSFSGGVFRWALEGLITRYRGRELSIVFSTSKPSAEEESLRKPI